MSYDFIIIYSERKEVKTQELLLVDRVYNYDGGILTLFQEQH